MLVTYVKNKKNQLIGAVVSVYIEHANTYKIGWSLCRKGDVFNKEKAKLIAIGRASAGGSNKPIPHTVKDKFNYMVDRSAKYFKQINVDATPSAA